jgi:prepilin-type N-terminal cleavage/methylation domain-containing protein
MRRARRGFTMLEAIVSLAIVALVCVGVLGAYGGALRADAIAADRLPLASLAVERLAAVDLEPGALTHLPDSVAHGTYAGAYDGVRWDVETRSVSTVPGLVDVAVRVYDANDAYTLRTRRYRTPIPDASVAR